MDTSQPKAPDAGCVLLLNLGSASLSALVKAEGERVALTFTIFNGRSAARITKPLLITPETARVLARQLEEVAVMAEAGKRSELVLNQVGLGVELPPDSSFEFELIPVLQLGK